MKNIIWGNLDLNPAMRATFPGQQDDFGNLICLPNMKSISSSFISESTYGGNGDELASSQHWRQSRASEV